MTCVCLEVRFIAVNKVTDYSRFCFTVTSILDILQVFIFIITLSRLGYSYCLLNEYRIYFHICMMKISRILLADTENRLLRTTNGFQMTIKINIWGYISSWNLIEVYRSCVRIFLQIMKDVILGSKTYIYNIKSSFSRIWKIFQHFGLIDWTIRKQKHIHYNLSVTFFAYMHQGWYYMNLIFDHLEIWQNKNRNVAKHKIRSLQNLYL